MDLKREANHESNLYTTTPDKGKKTEIIKKGMINFDIPNSLLPVSQTKT